MGMEGNFQTFTKFQTKPGLTLCILEALWTPSGGGQGRLGSQQGVRAGVNQGGAERGRQAPIGRRQVGPRREVRAARRVYGGCGQATPAGLMWGGCAWVGGGGLGRGENANRCGKIGILILPFIANDCPVLAQVTCLGEAGLQNWGRGRARKLGQKTAENRGPQTQK